MTFLATIDNRFYHKEPKLIIRVSFVEYDEEEQKVNSVKIPQFFCFTYLNVVQYYQYVRIDDYFEMNFIMRLFEHMLERNKFKNCSYNEYIFDCNQCMKRKKNENM